MTGSAARPPMDVAGRIGRLRATFEAAGVDALLVTDLANIRYLTGFTGSAALVLVSADDVLFVSDGRYGTQAEAELAAAAVAARIEISGDAQRRIVADAAEGTGRLGLEAEAVTWAAQRRYETEWFPAADLVPTEGLVAGLRELKDDGEVARIEAACRIADEALAAVLPGLLDGPSEADFALELENEMRRRGADDRSFDTIVAAGPAGAEPHHRAGARAVAAGDLVVIDFGALVDGYHSDMTRTFSVGEPDPTQLRMLEVVAASQAAGVATVAAGRPAAEVDAACRAVIAEAGWADRFTHGTGHGVGLDIHEGPRVGGTSTATLAAGHVVTVEPGVYLPGVGGVRVEDTVVVTADGCRPLTLAPKDPVLLRSS